MNFSAATLGVGVALILAQFLAALPWVLVAFFSRDELRNFFRNVSSQRTLSRLGVVLGGSVVTALPLFLLQEKDSLETLGKVYGAILQVQLIIDFFVLVFAFLLLVWPKGGAVALSAFREGIRQAMFWLLVLIALGLMTISPFLPYFTFGEDHIMVRELGYDTIMLFAVVFGTLAASLFISEEIEGRTAVTLMSKPVSRYQFLLGKFLGIVLAGLVMFGILGCYFEGVLLYKHWWDKLDPLPPPYWLTGALESWNLPGEVTDFLRGVGMWTQHTLETMPGLVLSFSQVLVLVAFAVSLATRVPMIVNITTVLVIYFLAHLAPVLVSIGERSQRLDPGSVVSRLLAFMAQLFDSILPGLDLFRVSPALISDAPPPLGSYLQYVGMVSVYGLAYTAIILLLGLILFEDRDLA